MYVLIVGKAEVQKVEICYALVLRFILQKGHDPASMSNSFKTPIKFIKEKLYAQQNYHYKKPVSSVSHLHLPGRNI